MGGVGVWGSVGGVAAFPSERRQRSMDIQTKKIEGSRLSETIDFAGLISWGEQLLFYCHFFFFFNRINPIMTVPGGSGVWKEKR